MYFSISLIIHYLSLFSENLISKNGPQLTTDFKQLINLNICTKMTSFKKLKCKGADIESACKIIIEAVNNGDIRERHAKKFTEELHEAVKGSFIHASDQRNFEFDRFAMETILGDFYIKKAYSLSQAEIFHEITRALRESDQSQIAAEIENSCKEKVVSKAGRRVLTPPLRRSPVQLTFPTSAAPVPSDQGQFPVCASHAIGKAVVGILDECGCDVIGGQEKVIEDLVLQVQPNKQAENPDRFHGEILNIAIKEKKNRKTNDVKVRIDVQTDPSTSPKPCNEAMDRSKLIKMVIRARMPSNHAIFAEEYDELNDRFNCINSWDGIDPRPIIKNNTDVYALDYVQITEIS